MGCENPDDKPQEVPKEGAELPAAPTVDMTTRTDIPKVEPTAKVTACAVDGTDQGALAKMPGKNAELQGLQIFDPVTGKAATDTSFNSAAEILKVQGITELTTVDRGSSWLGDDIARLGGSIANFFGGKGREVRLEGGTRATATFDDKGRVISVKGTNADGTTVQTDISYDKDGNVARFATPDRQLIRTGDGRYISVSNTPGVELKEQFILGSDGKPIQVTIDGKLQQVKVGEAKYDLQNRLIGSGDKTIAGGPLDVVNRLEISKLHRNGVFLIKDLDKNTVMQFDVRTNVFVLEGTATDLTGNIVVNSRVTSDSGRVKTIVRQNGDQVAARYDDKGVLDLLTVTDKDGNSQKWERAGLNEWKIGDRKVVGNVSIAGDGSITINDTANNLRTYIGIDGKQEIRKISGNAGEERVDYAVVTNDKGQIEQLVYRDNLYTASNGLKFNEQGNPYIEVPSPPGEATVAGDKSVVTFNLKDDPVTKLPAGTRVEAGPRSTSVFDDAGRLMYRYKAGEKIGPGSQPTEAYKYQQKPDGTYGVIEYSNGSGKFVLTDQKRDGFDVWKGPDGKEIVGNVSVLENGSIKTERRNDSGQLETVYQTIQGTTIITNSEGQRQVLDLSKSDPKERLLLSEEPIKNANGKVIGGVVKIRDGVPPNGTTYKYDNVSGTYSEIVDGKEVKSTKGKIEIFADGSVRIENAENNSLTQIEPTGESRTKFNRTGATILRDRSGNVTETNDGHGNVRRYQYDMDIKTKTPRLTRVEEGDALNGGQSWQLQPDGTWKSSKGDSFDGLMTVDKKTGDRIIEDRTSKSLTIESVADGTVRRENLDSAFTQILKNDKVEVSQDNHGNVINFYHGPSGEIDAVKLADGTVVVRDQQTLSEIQARDERFKSPTQVKVGNITLTDNKLVISSENKIEETDLKTGGKYTYEAVTSGSQISRRLIAASIPVGQVGAAVHQFKLDKSGNFVGSVDGGNNWNPATFKDDVLRLSLNSANQDWEYKLDGSYDIINRGQSRITHDTMGRISSEIDLKTRIIKSLEYKGLYDVPFAIRVLDANKNTETVWQRMDEGTDKNGTKVYQWKNLTTGQTFEGPVSTENEKVSFLSDSSRIVTKSSDGRTVTEHPDGTTYVSGPNGVESWKSPGGKEIVFKTEAGTLGILSGSTTKVTHHGRTYVLTGAPQVGENGILTYKAKDPDGKEITFTHNKNGMIEGVSDGKTVFAKGPGETPAVVVGDKMRESRVTGIAYDATTGGYKLTFEDKDLTGVIQRDGSQQFKKLVRDKSDPEKIIQRDMTTISADNLRTIQASYPMEGTIVRTTPSGLTYEIPLSYKETIRRQGTGGEDVNEWTRRSDNLWVSATGAEFVGERGFLVGTGELLTKESKPGDLSRNQEDLVKWTLHEHSGGSKEMYFTPENNYRYGVSYDRLRRPALIDNGSERTSLVYDDKGELKSLTVVNKKSNTSVTYTRLENGLFTSPENKDGVNIKVDFGNGTLTWSDAQGDKPVKVFANGSQILSDGTRVDLNPSALVAKRLTKLDDKGNIDPKAGVIEVHTNGDVMYRDGTGKEYLYNPDSGRVYVSGEKSYSFKGKISVDGKGNASIFDEDSDRLRVVNVNGALEQVLERQITQTYSDGSSITSVGGNSLVYKTADGRTITLQGKMDMVNDKPVITLSNPNDYGRLQDFLKEGSVCSQIKFTNGATLESSFDKPGVLLYKLNGQIREIKGQINPLTNEITITDQKSLPDDIKAALNSRDYGMPVGLRISLSNGATVEPNLANPGNLIYRQNGIAIPLKGSIDPSSGKITYDSHPELTAEMKAALDNQATQKTQLSWLKQGGVNETDFVSRDVVVDTKQQPKPNEKGDLVFETPQGKIVYNPAKPNEVSFLDKDGKVVSTIAGTVRVDSQGNAKLILRPESPDKANELTAKLQADGFKILSSGNPPAKIDLDAIGAPVVQQTRTQAGMESGTLTGYRPVQAAPELKGPGPVEVARAGLPPASTTTKTDGVAEVTTPDPAAALKLPGSAMNRVVNGQPADVINAPAEKAVVQQTEQTAQVQQAVEIRNRVEAIMTRNNLTATEKEEVRAALASNDLTGAMTRLAGSPVARTLGDINTEVIKALAPSFPSGKNPELYVAGSLAGLKFTENINTIRATVANRADFDVALAKFYADHNPAHLTGFVPPGVMPTFKAVAALPKEVRETALSSIPNILKSPSGGLATDAVANSIVATRQQLSAAVAAVSANPVEAARNQALVDAHIGERIKLVQDTRDLRVQLELVKGDRTLSEVDKGKQIAALQSAIEEVKARKADILAQEMRLRIPDAVKTALGAMASTEKGKEIIELAKSAMLKNSDELNRNLVLALLAMHRDNPSLVKGDNNLAGVTSSSDDGPANVRVVNTPAEVTTLAKQIVSHAVEQINQLVRAGVVVDAAYAAQLTTGLQARVEQAIRIAALNRSALDFLPSFTLTGDIGALVKDSGAKQFSSPVTSMPIDLNVKFGSLTGRGTTNIITADGTMISIERAMANPTLLAQLLANNQISINTLNGLLASADLVRILNIALPGGMSYTQLTNFSNPELAKYFGTTSDGIKMGFNVQVGYTSGLVYTSQNGILVPARLNSLEDGIFIQSLQGQKTITEVIKSNSGFITISNGKTRSDEDDEEDEEDEDGVVISGSKEDFGGKIPTAQPLPQSQNQTAVNQDPTAVLAHNQPVPLPDFLILPDGSMEPMPQNWKTKANHEHGHVDVVDENGKHVHVIDSKGNVLTDQQIEKAKQDIAAAKAAEAKAASTDFSPLASDASLNIPLEISDFNAEFGVENSGQAAYIDNDVNQTDLSDPLAYIKNLPIDANTGFPYDPDTGYILNPNNGDIIGNINDQPVNFISTANPFDGRLIDPLTGFPYDPATGILYDPLSGHPVGSVTPEADPIIDLSNDIAIIQENVETRLDDISAYSHVQDALNDAQNIDDVNHEVASDLATRPEGLDFGTDEEYKEKEKERLDNILNQLEEEEKRLEEQEDELRKRRDEIERLTKLMNSLLATRRQAELDRIRRLIEQQRKIEEFIAKDIRRIKYTVRKGDTLENIAKKHFRDPRLARLIYEMNPAKIKLSQEEGKTAYELTINSVLTLPSPRQAREWISRGKYLTAVDNSYVAQTELTADDLANMEKRRLNVESVLGALGMAADTNYKPTYTVRFGDSLRSIAMKHPALNDVSLWRLLAKVNDLSVETDAMGTPKVTLERGKNLNLPSKEEIAQFRKDNGALVHPSSLKQGANGPAELVTNVSLFKECPSCKENTPSGVSLCHCCGHVFQDTANGKGIDTKISTVSSQVTLTNIGGASTEHDPLAPKQDRDESDNVHTLNLPEIERKVANSDVSPLPKTQVDPKGVPNVSPAAKADITLKLNDPLATRVDVGLTNTGANPDAFLNSMSSMQKFRKDSFSIPSHNYNMSKLVENLSDTSRIVLLDSELDSNNQKAERWQLEVLKDDEWTPVIAYEIIGDNSIRHEYNVTGKARKSIKMNLPSSAVEEMVRNDLSRNWQDYCQKFLTGKKLSQ